MVKTPTLFSYTYKHSLNKQFFPGVKETNLKIMVTRNSFLNGIKADVEETAKKQLRLAIESLEKTDAFTDDEKKEIRRVLCEDLSCFTINWNF